MDLKDYSDFEVPWGEVGYITYKRTYARELGRDKKEEWEDTVNRVIKASNTQLGCDFTEQEANEIKDQMMNLKGSIAGRFLWQLGTRTVNKLGLPSLQNCAGTVVDHPVRPFTWAFELLMLGSGVGYNIQKENVYQLPKVKKKVKLERKDQNDADFIIPDSREGWVKFLEKVLEASFYTGEGFSFATHLIRSKGSPIKGFGGVASGPEDLVWGIFQINKILNKRSGQRLRPIDCLDIMNIIGSIVVSGNVRRSAQIALGDYDDFEFLMAKRWDLGNIPNWRAMSNNSVICSDIDKLPEQFWEGYKGNGEPYGLINLEASREMGRSGDYNYKDPDVIVYNPCVTGETQLLTSEGYEPIQDVVGKDISIWNGEEWSPVRPFSTGVNEIVEVNLTDGTQIRCTPYHEFLTVEGFNNKEAERMEAKDLQKGQTLLKVEMPFAQVESVNWTGEYEETFCVTEPKLNQMTVEGVVTGNCGEQSLNDKETCCLAEVFLPNIESKEELFKVTQYLYRICKHSLAIKCSLKDTESVVHKNMRMGIGITGYLQASSEQQSWLSENYEQLREFDKQYSAEKGFPESIKLTTVKPSGTLSLLAGVTPGAHPGYSQYHIRRIRMSSNLPLVQVCRENGYPVEYARGFDGTDDHSTVIVSFPCKFPDGTVTGNDMGAVNQLEVSKRLQREWSDNSVSCTVYYRPEELGDIKEWLRENFKEMKTLSFLLHQDHGFAQAPMEEITKSEYEEFAKNVTKITSVGNVDIEDMEMNECEGGHCPIR